MGRLKAAQDEIRIVKESLAAEATPEPVIPWEPKIGGFCVNLSGVAASLNTDHGYCAMHKVGRTFQTEEEAAEASKSFTFYQRLYKLAKECNAKHTAKHTKYGYFRVFYSYVGFKWCVHGTNKAKQEVTDLFTSESSAQEACDIMNRDGWILPTSPKS